MISVSTVLSNETISDIKNEKKKIENNYSNSRFSE